MEETDEDIIQLPEDADILREQGDDKGGQPMENPGQGLDQGEASGWLGQLWPHWS